VNRRRILAALLAAAWAPLLAQQPGRIQRIGWLDYSSSSENLGTFVKAMVALGWVDGSTFRIAYRGGEGRPERLAAAAGELTRLPADVIVAPGAAEALAARKATDAIPIVMTAVDDPVALGLVASFARPGGNVTGLATARSELDGKLLSLLRELLPRATSAGVIVDGTDPQYRSTLRHLQDAAGKLGIAINAAPVGKHTEVEPAFAAFKRQATPMVVVVPSSMFIPNWVADLALKHGLPLASTAPGYAFEGGLMAYSDDWNAVYDRAATIVDRILKGAKPAGIPVELPTKFKLIVNAKTARALRLSIPQSIMIRADSVIE
jgi:putative ABC transport system substrate-binding protein